jgi:hypothetical protein
MGLHCPQSDNGSTFITVSLLLYVWLLFVSLFIHTKHMHHRRLYVMQMLNSAYSENNENMHFQ